MIEARPPMAGIEQARHYWDHRAVNFASDCERVDQSLRAQRMRFEIFVRARMDLHPAPDRAS
jgi:hypothetical protein